jgi:hypothetical protein
MDKLWSFEVRNEKYNFTGKVTGFTENQQKIFLNLKAYDMFGVNLVQKIQFF